ncbi:MAG: glycosyltransferase family 2 protein [Gemmatimonadota bacterium]|nr:glycosyltransferase family 2 protein [Gemmatimonadota bacterium]
MSEAPLVSAVIPSADRPDLVVRAVRSALAQTHTRLEVVVVIDGPDRATREAVAAIPDPRLRWIELEARSGPGAARNAGVSESRGEWIAFLDDDDEWFPDRLSRQLETAGRMPGPNRVIVGRVVARSGRDQAQAWPRRLPESDEPLSEYLFARRGARWGEALIHTSTWLIEADLARGLPFRRMWRHEDLDWLLRAERERGARPVFVDGETPVAVWSVDSARPRASAPGERATWTDSMTWARENRELFTPRAYAAFLLVQVGADARRCGDDGAFPALLREAVTNGRPRVRDLALFAGIRVRPGRTGA